MKHRLSKRSISLLMAVALVLITGSGVLALKHTAKQPERKVAQERTWKIAVMTVTKQDHRPELTLYGRIESPYETTLTAASTAYIDSVPAKEGMLVQQGNVLVELDQRDLLLKKKQREADVLNIKAKIAAEHSRYQYDQQSLVEEKKLLLIARNAVSRQSALKQRNLSSITQLEEAKQGEAQQALSVNKIAQAIADHGNRLNQLQAQLAQAKALLAQTTLDIERAVVKAPLTGRISQVMVSPGARVKAGDALLTLYDVANLEVRAQIPSRWLPLLKQQLQVTDAATETLKPLNTTKPLETSTPLKTINPLKTTAPVNGTILQGNVSIAVKLNRLAAAVSKGQGGVDGIFQIEASGYFPLELGRSVVLTLRLPSVINSVAVPVTAIYGSQRVFKVVDDHLQSVTVERVGEIHKEGKEWALVKATELHAGDQLMITQLPNAITGMKIQQTNKPLSPTIDG